MIEKCLIEHCAPTLASLKAANLFNACCEDGEKYKPSDFYVESVDESKGCEAAGTSQPRQPVPWFMYTGKNSWHRI